MMNDIEDSCPSQEDLSEYYDLLRSGKLLAPTFLRLDAHVKTCTTCRNTIDAYRRLDALLAAELQPPAGLAETVKGHCRQQAEQDAMRRIAFLGFWRRLAARAAMLVVAFAICYGVWHSMDKAGRQKGDTSLAMAQETQTQQQDAVQTLAHSAPDALQHQESTESPLDAKEKLARPPMDDASKTLADAPQQRALKQRELQNVGLDSPKMKAHLADTRIRELPSAIKHIWMVDDIGQSADAVRGLAEKYSARLSNAADMDGARILTLKGISDRRLQELVQTLNDQKWALVSPMLPQPGQAEKVDFKDKNVIYTLYLVKKDH